MKVDVDALATWVLEKAHEQHGISLVDAHVRFAVVAAVKDAVRSDGDELHVTCKIGEVTLDERMSRTAAENLFAPPPRPHEDDGPELSTTESTTKAPPWMLPLFVVLVAATVSFIVWFNTRHTSEEHHNDKREMHR